jgi:Fe-S cluster assembly iron-binding protein IscA
VPSEKDNVYEVEGIKFIFLGESAKYSKGFLIDFRGGWFGKRITVEQLGFNGHSCG